VAGGFLHRLLGRSAPLPPEVAPALAELEELGSARPVWSGQIAFLRDMLPAIYEDIPSETAPSLSTEDAAAKLAGGVPLLRGESLAVDARALARRWQRVCAALHDRPGGGAAQTLAEAVKRCRLDPGEMLAALLAGRPEEVHGRADQLGLDASLTATVLRLSVFPVLEKVGAALAPLRESAGWDPGYCPTCGSWPLLGEFRGLEQLRFLRCGWCAAEWEFPRLRCPFCGQRDHHLLGYLHVEGEEARHRATTCEECHGYVKMVTALSALSGPRLLVADVATMHLDLAAAERGFTSVV
jgi:FdhE protein